MASVLLLGSPDTLRPLIAAIPSEHEVFVLDKAPSESLPREVRTFAADTTQLDAILDCEIHAARKRSTLHALPRSCFEGALLITNTVTTTATAVAADLATHLEHTVPTIGISYVPHLFAGGALVEAAAALQTSPADAERGAALVGMLTGKPVEMMVDRVALVAVRTLVLIINEAAFALMEGVAGAGDIDVAMKLGTNYPEGPLRWADAIGLDTCLAVLEALHAEYGEERYRPCVLLRQLARAGREIGERKAEIGERK